MTHASSKILWISARWHISWGRINFLIFKSRVHFLLTTTEPCYKASDSASRFTFPLTRLLRESTVLLGHSHISRPDRELYSLMEQTVNETPVVNMQKPTHHFLSNFGFIKVARYSDLLTCQAHFFEPHNWNVQMAAPRSLNHIDHFIFLLFEKWSKKESSDNAWGMAQVQLIARDVWRDLTDCYRPNCLMISRSVDVSQGSKWPLNPLIALMISLSIRPTHTSNF